MQHSTFFLFFHYGIIIHWERVMRVILLFLYFSSLFFNVGDIDLRWSEWRNRSHSKRKNNKNKRYNSNRKAIEVSTGSRDREKSIWHVATCRVGNKTRWDEIYQSQSCYIYVDRMKKYHCLYFFWIKIYFNSVPKEIPSQLVKFSFLIGNETEWDIIYQSHSYLAYIIGIKKYLTFTSKFFYKIKIYLSQFHPK